MMKFSEAVKVIFNDINTTNLPDHLSFGKPKREVRKRLPSSLSLDGKYIAGIDFDEEVSEIIENVRSIHLNNNDLRSWDDVILLLQNIPVLESLNLSSNPLPLFQHVDLQKNFIFHQLKALILNETHARWEMVLLLIQRMPSLEVLHLSMNKQILTKNVIEMSLSEKYPKIRELYYSSNDCCENNELILIGDLFPSLENLVLFNNHLVTLLPPNDDDQSLLLHNHFLNLTSLSISNNLIDDWKSIDYLQRFQKLTDLRVASQPLYEGMSEEDVWNELVSRLDNVTKLNGSIINEDIRCKAQRSFLRYYLNDETKPSKFEALMKIHPDIAPLLDIDLSPEIFIPVKVICGGESKDVSVDVRYTVGELKKMCCKQFGIQDSSLFSLSYYDHEAMEVYGPEKLTFPNRKLFTYNVVRNDWFSLDRKI